MHAPSETLTRPFFTRSFAVLAWAHVVWAALAMVGTLPGRTQGLGLITEPLLRDLGLDRGLYARIHLGATLAGSLFCLGMGRLLDRRGSRVTLAAVSLLLGLAVLWTARATGPVSLALSLTFTRGFGQSALSVISITMVGQWFVRRLSTAMAVYSVLLTIGFMVAFPVLGHQISTTGWRAAWQAVGLLLICGLTPLALAFVRSSPESVGWQPDGRGRLDLSGREPVTGATLRQALSTPAFWVFGLGCALYGLTSSGIGLFNESVLAERGFPAEVYHRTLAISAVTGLAGNFLGGWLASRWTMNRLLALAMALLAGGLAALPHLRTPGQVDAQAVLMGLAGGFVMVLFFGVWAACYGRAHLGKIQGAAQLLTVVFSALGPVLLADCAALTGSYAFIFRLLAVVVGVLALAAWRVRLPDLQQG